jgi:hypothetical protein
MTESEIKADLACKSMPFSPVLFAGQYQPSQALPASIISSPQITPASVSPLNCGV